MVFTLNTVIGFACALGVDMGFNYKHHHDEIADHHHEGIADHHDEKNDSDKDGCCNDAVIKFQQVEKSLTQNAKVNVDVPIILLAFHSLLGIDLFNISTSPVNKYAAPLYYSPPPDIRIAIQSFQI